MAYRQGNMGEAHKLADIAKKLQPKFIKHWYLMNMRQRLFTKDPVFYKKFKNYGTSNENWYYVDKEWRCYINHKRIR